MTKYQVKAISTLKHGGQIKLEGPDPEINRSSRTQLIAVDQAIVEALRDLLTRAGDKWAWEITDYIKGDDDRVTIYAYRDGLDRANLPNRNAEYNDPEDLARKMQMNWLTSTTKPAMERIFLVQWSGTEWAPFAGIGIGHSDASDD